MLPCLPHGVFRRLIDRPKVGAAFMSLGVFSRSINRPTVDAVIATQVRSTVVCHNATMEA